MICVPFTLKTQIRLGSFSVACYQVNPGAPRGLATRDLIVHASAFRIENATTISFDSPLRPRPSDPTFRLLRYSVLVAVTRL
jgi:hypothetical protein